MYRYFILCIEISHITLRFCSFLQLHSHTYLPYPYCIYREKFTIYASILFTLSIFYFIYSNFPYYAPISFTFTTSLTCLTHTDQSWVVAVVTRRAAATRVPCQCPLSEVTVPLISTTATTTTTPSASTRGPQGVSGPHNNNTTTTTIPSPLSQKGRYGSGAAT